MGSIESLAPGDFWKTDAYHQRVHVHVWLLSDVYCLIDQGLLDLIVVGVGFISLGKGNDKDFAATSCGLRRAYGAILPSKRLHDIVETRQFCVGHMCRSHALVPRRIPSKSSNKADFWVAPKDIVSRKRQKAVFILQQNDAFASNLSLQPIVFFKEPLVGNLVVIIVAADVAFVVGCDFFVARMEIGNQPDHSIGAL